MNKDLLRAHRVLLRLCENSIADAKALLWMQMRCKWLQMQMAFADAAVQKFFCGCNSAFASAKAICIRT